MADWKMPVSYNYNQSYHAYAYGFVYNPHGPDQTHASRSWSEAAYSSSAAVAGGFYSSQTSSQSPPDSPDCPTPNTNGHYASSVVYYADTQSHTQNGRLFLANNRVLYDEQPKDQAGTGSDTPSDSEAHTPDSWSSGSSRENGIPHTELDLTHWGKKEQVYELSSGFPDGTEVVPNSLVSPAVEPTTVSACGGTPAVLPPPEQLPTKPRKAKARTAFSEGQMNALNDRFNMQRYLTPSEMKTLAGLTGLTYKQVKTWFQNRRMKLKRHQKDNSWVSERYITAGNAQTRHSQFQVDVPILGQDLANSQFRDSVYKKSPQQAPSFYPNYTLSPSQVSARPQGNWPLPPAVTHYDFPNPSSYMPVGVNSDGGSAVDSSNDPTQLVAVLSASQWSS